MMNKVFLVGRLTRDPELRYTSSNLATMRCAIAVDRQFAREGEERGADFINIVAFGNRAETMSKYLTKGSQIAVDGRIQTGSYDGQDGKKVYTTDVVVENFQFLDTKGSRNMDNVDMPTNDDIPNDDTTDSSDPFADFGAKIEVSDSELPF
ncbi:MAG: single-stranded DNA-binding protein [Bacilli bacterium]|nr:single-stranded DNA-binding protein [Bacilli bacterium]